MTRAVALLLSLVLLSAAPGAALAANTAKGAKSSQSATTVSGSGGVSPQTSTASSSASATQPAVPITPNGSTNPLSGGVSPVAPAPTPTGTTQAQTATAATVQTNGSSTLSSSSAFVIVLGAVIVLGGIAFFIWRDARRRAPVRAEAGADAIGRRTGSKAPQKSRKLSPAERKRRKRGKAR